jgi:myoferlin
LPKDGFILPKGWKWNGDWEIAPELSLLYEKDAGHSNYMEEVYEQHYRKLPGASWSKGHDNDQKPFLWIDYVIKVH